MTAPTESASPRQLCTFRVHEHHLGIDVAHVQEVLREQPMTPVPLSPAVVTGLINLRGQIVTAIDLRRRLGLPPRATEQPALNLVVRTSDGLLSLLVDDIGDVVEVDHGLFETSPGTLAPTWRALIGGVYKLTPQLLLVLDVAATSRLEPAT